MKLDINAPGFIVAMLQDAEVATWFTTDARPANEPEKGIYYFQASIGLKEKLTICIKPRDPGALADQLRNDYKQ